METRTIVYHVADYRIVSLYNGHGRPTFKILATDSYIGKTADGGYKTKAAAIRAARRFAELETVWTRYHESLLAQCAAAWRKAVQTGAWQDWRAHSALNVRVNALRIANRA